MIYTIENLRNQFLSVRDNKEKNFAFWTLLNHRDQRLAYNNTISDLDKSWEYLSDCLSRLVSANETYTLIQTANVSGGSGGLYYIFRFDNAPNGNGMPAIAGIGGVNASDVESRISTSIELAMLRRDLQDKEKEIESMKQGDGIAGLIQRLIENPNMQPIVQGFGALIQMAGMKAMGIQPQMIQPNGAQVGISGFPGADTHTETDTMNHSNTVVESNELELSETAATALDGIREVISLEEVLPPLAEFVTRKGADQVRGFLPMLKNL